MSTPKSKGTTKAGPLPDNVRPLPQPPPHDLDAEQLLIGLALMGGSHWEAATGTGLAVADFYSLHHRHIWQAALDAGAHADATVVAQVLRDSGHIGEPYERTALAGYLALMASPSLAGRYAAIVAETAARRRIIEAAATLADAAATVPLDKLAEHLDAVARHANTAPSITARSTWWPVDLTEALTGDDIPQPSIWRRSDGHALLYPGRTHGFIGETESLKSWAAAAAAVEVLNSGGHVLWVDYEDDERNAISRLRALHRFTDAALLERFHFVHPEEPLNDRNGKATTANRHLGELLEAYPFTLAVLDGITDGMATEGLDPLSTEGAAVFARRVAKRIAAAPSAPAVVSIDHVPKSTEARGRFAIGSQHKVSGLTGAAYTFTATKPLGRAITQPITGLVTVKGTKDRPGHVRGFCNATEQIFTAAVFEVTSFPDGGISTALLLPTDTDSQVPPIELLRWIGEHLTLYPGATFNAMAAAKGGDRNAFTAAVKWLARQGHISITKVGRSNAHDITPTGSTYLDGL